MNVRSSFGTVSLQKPGVSQEPVLRRDTGALSQMENFTVLRPMRSAMETRLVLWLVLLVVPAILLFKFSDWEKSVILCAACENQYRRRTLKYIHRADGKKA